MRPRQLAGLLFLIAGLASLVAGFTAQPRNMQQISLAGVLVVVGGILVRGGRGSSKHGA
jgi:ribose/xylose/arabinose/galactoside ABC-type transport system permease subunit